jgi:hypothetical protein
MSHMRHSNVNCHPTMMKEPAKPELDQLWQIGEWVLVLLADLVVPANGNGRVADEGGYRVRV